MLKDVFGKPEHPFDVDLFDPRFLCRETRQHYLAPEAVAFGFICPGVNSAFIHKCLVKHALLPLQVRNLLLQIASYLPG